MIAFLSLFIACQNQPPAYTPGVLVNSGETLVTVNGNTISEGVIDALLTQVPEDRREEFKTGPNYERLKEQLITTEILYREAIKAGLHKKEDIQVAMSLAEREVLANSIVGQLAESRITDETMKKWYDDHMVQFKKEEADLAMIVVNTEEEANKAVAELDGGADFAIVATKYSIDPQTKATGGQMGSVDLRSMPPQMKMELDKVEDGKHSPAINMGSAFGILKVNKRTNTLTPLEEVKDQIKEDMLQEESQTLVKELRDAATVVTPEAAAPEAAVVVPSVDASTITPEGPAKEATTK